MEYKTNYVNGKQDGLEQAWSPNGQLDYERTLKNDDYWGPYKEWYESGKLREEGNFVENNKDGVWKYYTEDGELDYQEKYSNGELIK